MAACFFRALAIVSLLGYAQCTDACEGSTCGANDGSNLDPDQKPSCKGSACGKNEGSYLLQKKSHAMAREAEHFEEEEEEVEGPVWRYQAGDICFDIPPPLGWRHNTCELQMLYTDNCEKRREGTKVDGYCYQSCGVCTVDTTTTPTTTTTTTVAYEPCTDKQPPKSWKKNTCESQLHETSNCEARRAGTRVDGYCSKTCGVCTVTTTTTTTTTGFDWDPASGRGAPWTWNEMKAIRETMWKLLQNDRGKWENTLCGVLGEDEYPCFLERFEPNEYAECDSEFASPSSRRIETRCNGIVKKIPAGALPTGPRFLRLGFHDCVRYTDKTGGCDGCLNFDGMFVMKNMDETKLMPNGKYKKTDLPYDLTKGGNNNLAGTADILEKIYTDHTFGMQRDYLTQSLKDLGKSRADLWAYATLVVAEFYMEMNNWRCMTNEPKHLYNYPSAGVPHDCQIRPSRPFTFYSGRKDCPEGDKPAPEVRYREYQTDKEEFGANPHASGKEVSDWFASEFNFTGRDTVAIMGVHVAGGFDSNNDVFRYTWCGREVGHDEILNNIYYRMMAYKPIYMQKDLDTVQEALDNGEEPPKTRRVSWVQNLRWITPSAGPVQWFMRTDVEHGSPFVSSGSHATMLNTDMGLFLDFDVTSGGFPIRNGTDGHCSLLKTEVKGGEPIVGLHDAAMTCLQTKQNDDGMTLAAIVDQYANNQNLWWDDFVVAMEKMLSNGATNLVPHVMSTTTTTPMPTPLGSRSPCTSKWCCGGYKSKSYCCAASCGGCGGSGCKNLPGGAENCCTGNIKSSGVLCQNSSHLVCRIP